MPANQRLNRKEILRSRLERPKDYTPPGAMVQVDPLALGPDVKLRWLRQFFNRAEEDVQSLFKRFARGWVPVKVEEIPSLKFLSDPKGNIASNGCILCKIDAKVAQMDVEYYEDQALGNLAGASRDFVTSSSDARIEKTIEANSRKSFRGRAPNSI